MKKLLFVLLSIIAIAFNAQARSAVRGNREGVTAENLRANAPAIQTARYPARAKAYNTCDIQVLPILKGKKFTPKSYTTQFGQNWAAIGGGVYILDYVKHIQKFGTIYRIEGSINVYNANDDTYGLNLLVPLNALFTNITNSNYEYELRFPVYAHPYYRFNISDNVVITPFVNFGAGLDFTYVHLQSSSMKKSNLMWLLGAGVEISLYKDFSITPKYSWFNLLAFNYSYTHNIGGEFAWRFASNMTAIAEYSYINSRDNDIHHHTASIKVRYEF